MQKYQLSHGGQLPPEADNDQKERVRRACAWDKVQLSKSAQGNIEYWQIGKATLCHAVRKHIEDGRKVFRKFDPTAPDKLFESNLQATVTLYQGKDVYVEMILTQTVFIIICAHEHTTLKRLPQ